MEADTIESLREQIKTAQEIVRARPEAVDGEPKTWPALARYLLEELVRHRTDRVTATASVRAAWRRATGGAG